MSSSGNLRHLPGSCRPARLLALAALLSCFALSPDLCPTARAAHGYGTMMADSRPEPAHAPISVTECNLRRVSRPGKPDITVSYPMLGRKDVDRDVAGWVERIASTFEAELAPRSLELEQQDRPPCELMGSYTLTRPSANALSIVFEIWTYTGGAHGNLDVIPLTYSLISGQRLGLVDIFENVDKALEIMSDTSRKELAIRLGGGREDSMIHDGTVPVAENFSALALVPGGVRVYFQPYQVAPWAAGAQRVFIPLEKLAPAGPLRLLWDE